MSNSGVTTESGGRQNMFPSETRHYIDESVSYDGYIQNAEKVKGRWAIVLRCTNRCLCYDWKHNTRSILITFY